MIAYLDIPPFGKKRVTSMSDHDNPAEHPTADGVPPWRQPIEYTDDLNDDDDEGPSEDSPGRRSSCLSFQTRPDKNPKDYFKFVNLQGEDELFDIEEPIAKDRFWHGRPGTPRADETVFGIEPNRWVLVYGQLPGEEDDGSPNRELSPTDISRWFWITRHQIPEGLGPLRPDEESGGTTAPTRLDRKWRPEPITTAMGPETSQSPWLPMASLKAYQSYSQAIQAMGADHYSTTDKEVYNYIENNNFEIYEDELPSFETWVRNVRHGRKFYGTQKNSPRAGREHGKSIVRQDEVESIIRQDEIV